ncbi:MAG TPA: hypothetical protein VMW50_03675 [Dehalococcoidia bacterium]|nr:hypothetical protein [Dehalococcoidia bacterium]
MGGGGSGGSSGGDVVRTTRYAPYVEEAHNSFLNNTTAVRNTIIDDSPYLGFTNITTDEAFFGIGYIMGSFPSLYDTFGKYMAGLDIEELWNKVASEIFNNPDIDSDIKSRMQVIDDDITLKLAAFTLSMRNVNCTNSSSFVVGKAVIEDYRLKMLSDVSKEVKFRLLPNIQTDFITSLNWNSGNVKVYALSMKLYFTSKLAADDDNYTNAARDILWPFTVLGFELMAIGALQGTRAFQKTADRVGRSGVSKGLLVLSNTVTGAYIGSSWGPVGTVVGAVVGFVIGIATLFFE